MSDISSIENIEWRTPNEDDLERLDFVIKHNRMNNYLLIGAVLFIVIGVIGLITTQLKNSLNNWPISVLAFIIAAVIVVFIVRRIHLSPEYKVADVVLNEIVFVQSSESSVSYTATISQGETVLKNINIYGKKHPEVNSNVLLFMFNNDSWTVGVV